MPGRRLRPETLDREILRWSRQRRLQGQQNSLISKSLAPESLVQSLRQVVDGRNLPRLPSALGPPLKARNGATESVLEVLTDREREIMRLVSGGLSNKEIARRLSISQGTIKVHLHNIYEKLGINNRTALAAVAISQSTRFENGPVKRHPHHQTRGHPRRW